MLIVVGLSNECNRMQGKILQQLLLHANLVSYMYIHSYEYNNNESTRRRYNNVIKHTSSPMLAGFPFIIVWFSMNLTSSVGDYKIDLKKCVLSSVIMSITRVIGKWVFKCTRMCVFSACMSMGRVYTDWHNYLVSRYLSRMPLPDGLCLFARTSNSGKWWMNMRERVFIMNLMTNAIFCGIVQG